MKRPIDAGDIRKGDVVRAEFRDVDSLLAGVTAREYKAGHDCDGGDRNDRVVDYFLLDRPAYALVRIPEKPGLGWLAAHGHRELAVWRRGREGLEGTPTMIFRDPIGITEWTPATAVPTVALGELRVAWGSSGFFRPDAVEAIRKFLAAVDEANQA